MTFPFKSPKPSSLKAKTMQALCFDVSIHDMLQPEPTAFGVLHMPLFNPGRFEAGTPAIAEAIGLGATVDYLSGIGMERIHDYEVELANYLYNSLLSVPKVRIYGPVPSQVVKRAALCSFNIEDIHPTDIATVLDQQHGVAVRSGHHCAQPLHRYLGIYASARASLHFYNTKEDVDNFIRALTDAISFFTSFK